ncbi:DUF6625 family protein [Flavobacterium hydrophilum]|uniref:Glycosyl transferase n=1 Tax=Flavobacterium hydrophilum TaxID=2211445 RepID=A0A2V4C5V4_9FLAO|nr:DUF6625 family protein [Flavobacterium hydrophilum]PXY46736.1 hypothetical protein DMB68_06140 [Flavobacterium hydrophilum]
MNIQHSIALITCWHGDYPWYFPYFIKSCIANPTIDFIIVTGNTQEIPNKPSNVIIVHQPLDEFKTLAAKKFGFELNFDKPYKLCDFKPAYGFLYEDIFEKYDFWGHGDIDMVYGNIRGFITPDILNNYDLINSHKNFITGTFCLYRNNYFMRTLFMESPDYQKVFSSPEWTGFDECNSLYDELQTPGVSVFDFPNHRSMTHVVCKAQKEGRIKVLFESYFHRTMNDKMRWDNGRVIFSNKKECLFYDMIKYKAECEDQTVTQPIPDIFYFNKKGINKKSFWRLLGLKIIPKKKSFKKVQIFHN